MCVECVDTVSVWCVFVVCESVYGSVVCVLMLCVCGVCDCMGAGYVLWVCGVC